MHQVGNSWRATLLANIMDITECERRETYNLGLVHQCGSIPMISFAVFDQLHQNCFLSWWLIVVSLKLKFCYSWFYMWSCEGYSSDGFSWIPFSLLLFLVQTINNALKEEADLVEDTFLFNDLVGLAFQTS